MVSLFSWAAPPSPSSLAAVSEVSKQPIVSFASREEWADWLEREAESSDGAWLQIAKKDGGRESVSYAEALEEALRFGWIDGQKRRLDDEFWLQRFTPRRVGSRWSQINREKAQTLIEAGRMAPAGLREVEAAKADGRWEAAYAGARAATVPDDLREALARDERARENFAALSGSDRYSVLYRVQEAKRPETRARRIEKYVVLLAAGKPVK